MLRAVICVLLCLLLAGASQAEQTMNFQGQLKSAETLVSGTKSITFRLFNTETGGTALWTETQNVEVSNGIFSADLGLMKPLPTSAFDGTTTWVEVAVDGVTLSGRKRLGSVAASFAAQRAVYADTAAVAWHVLSKRGLPGIEESLLWSDNGTNVWLASGLLGIGTTSPTMRIESKANLDGVATSGSSAKGGFRIRGANYYNTVLDMGIGAGGVSTNSWIQATDANDLSQKYTLSLNPNGGNVGIRTTTPTMPLETRTNADGIAGSGSNPSGGFRIRGITYYNTVLDMGIGAGGNPTNAWFQVADANNLGLSYNLSLNPNGGNVGIRTTTPTMPLETRTNADGIAGSGSNPSGGFRIRGITYYNTVLDMGIGAGGNPTNAWFQVADANNLGLSYNLSLNPNGGNVGVGKSNPAYKLDVQGNVGITGDLYVSGQKCRTVETSKGMVSMNAVESGHALFMDDQSSARLVDGRCRVNLSPTYLETITVNGQYPLAVYVTFYGPHGGGWYVERDGAGFTVVDPSGSNVEISWVVFNRQRGFEPVHFSQTAVTAAK